MYAGMMRTSRVEKYRRMRELLHEKQWRHYLALEAQERGAVMQVAHEAGVSYNTIRRGLRELEAGERYSPGERQRRQLLAGKSPMKNLLHCIFSKMRFMADGTTPFFHKLRPLLLSLFRRELAWIGTLNVYLIACHPMHATQRFDQGLITANQVVDIGFRQAMRNHDHPRQDARMGPGG